MNRRWVSEEEWVTAKHTYTITKRRGKHTHKHTLRMRHNWYIRKKKAEDNKGVKVIFHAKFTSILFIPSFCSFFYFIDVYLVWGCCFFSLSLSYCALLACCLHWKSPIILQFSFCIVYYISPFSIYIYIFFFFPFFFISLYTEEKNIGGKKSLLPPRDSHYCIFSLLPLFFYSPFISLFLFFFTLFPTRFTVLPGRHRA